MAQPDPYDRQFSFSLFESENPSSPKPGAQLDAEFDAVKAVLDEILARLALIQRDDGVLKNASVGVDQIAPDLDDYIQAGGA